MKYTIFSILFCTSLLFSSCSDFLQPKIYSDFTDENFPKTDTDIDLVLASFYANFSSTWGPQDPSVSQSSESRKMWAAYCGMNGWSQASSGVTDEMFDSWYPAWRFGALWSFTNDKTFYQGCYQRVAVVAKATQFISLFQSQLNELNAKSSKSKSDYEAIRKRELAIAEIRAFRGWTMFLLYDWFGAVEVKYDPSTLGDMGFASRPMHESSSEYTKNFLNKMVSDLKYGADNLLDANITVNNMPVDVFIPSTNSTSKAAIDKLGTWGRLNKDVARMLLMKHYMNRAAETSNVALWDSAKFYCDQVRTNSIYSLNPVYSKVFTDIAINGPKSNKEVIWATTFGPKAESQSYQANTPKGCIEILGLSRNGLGWGGYFMPWDFYYTFDTTGIVNTGIARDERLKTIADWYVSSDKHEYRDSINNVKVFKTKRYIRWHNYTSHLNMIENAKGRYDSTSYRYEQPGNLELFGAVVVKWLVSENDATRGQHSSIPFRYADVLLSAAEIELNRSGGSQSAAQDYIKMITDRANTSNSVSRQIDVTSGQGVKIRVIGAKSALAAGCPKDTLMEFLFQERGRELYWEGWRRMDMIRFKGTKGATNKFIEFASRYNVPLTDNHYVKFPIPQKPLYESGKAYQQNQGY